MKDRRRSQWGILLFLAAPGVIFLAAAAAGRFGGIIAGEKAPIAGRIGMSIALLCILAGHLSYSRAHNLKIYLAGYLTGLVAMAWFVMQRGVFGAAWVSPSSRIPDLLFFLLFLNLALISTLPSYVTYWVTKRITYSLLILELVLLGLLGYRITGGAWIVPVLTFGIFRINMLGPLLFIIIVVLSFIFIRRQFYLGGVLSGTALLYLSGWLDGDLYSAGKGYRDLVFIAGPAYMLLGFLIHWVISMQHRGERDPLLSIYNRNYCNKIISERTRIKTTPPFSVAMLDIDHFKKVNDTYGHQAGDEVLVNTAQVISREAAPRGIVCRYGGEEIIIFFPRMTAAMAAKVMEKVRLQIGKSVVKSGQKKIKVTVSSGIAHRETSAQSIQEVILAADKALYKAKKGGRNQVRTGKAASSRGRISTIKIKILGGETADKT